MPVARKRSAAQARKASGARNSNYAQQGVRKAAPFLPNVKGMRYAKDKHIPRQETRHDA